MSIHGFSWLRSCSRGRAFIEGDGLPFQRRRHSEVAEASGVRASCRHSLPRIVADRIHLRRPVSPNQLFEATDVEGLIVGVEICEDLWVPVPPSSLQALQGATVLLNLSASNEVLGKPAYRRLLVGSQSGRCLAGYVYLSCGVDESTTDVTFGGHCLIAENGTILEESERFQRKEHLLIADLDWERLRMERQRR